MKRKTRQFPCWAVTCRSGEGRVCPWARFEGIVLVSCLSYLRKTLGWHGRRWDSNPAPPIFNVTLVIISERAHRPARMRCCFQPAWTNITSVKSKVTSILKNPENSELSRKMSRCPQKWAKMTYFDLPWHLGLWDAVSDALGTRTEIRFNLNKDRG